MGNVTSFSDRKSEVLCKRIDTLVQGMSEEDRDTLQNDRTGGFQFPKMPSILADFFREWYGDYGSGESGLSHENIHETYALFYEHIVENPSDWDSEQVEMAQSMLWHGEVGPRPVLNDNHRG